MLIRQNLNNGRNALKVVPDCSETLLAQTVFTLTELNLEFLTQ